MKRRVMFALFALAIASPLARAYTVEQESATTTDGVTLAIERLKNPGGVPILMIHGFGSNMYEYDHPSQPAARDLASRGYDVWLANWRRTGKAPFRSGGGAGYSFDDVAIRDVPALVERVRTASGGQRPFVIGHSMGAMVMYAYLEGTRYDRVVVAKTPRLTWTGIAWDPVYGTRVVSDPALSAARNAGIRGFIGIAGPARMQWKVQATAFDFWRYNYWDYDIILTSLSWSPGANVAAYSTPEVPAGRFTNFLTDDLANMPYVGPEVRPFLSAVAAQIGRSFLSSTAMWGPNMDGTVTFDALDWAVDDTSTTIFRQFMDGIRLGTFREAHVSDPARAPYAYADHYDLVTAPVLLVAGQRDKLCCDDVLYSQGFLPMRSADKSFLDVDAGHVDIVMGKNAPTEVWAKIAAWMAAR